MEPARAPLVHLRVLGPLQVLRIADDCRVAGQPRRAALLAYLVLAEPRGPQSRDLVVSLLWPEANAEQGRQSLRNALHELRTELGDGVIVSEGKQHVRVVPGAVRCDLLELEAELAKGDVADALARYADLMAGFSVRDAGPFERWHEELRGRVRSRVLEAARREARRLADAGCWGDAEALVTRARAIEPEDEGLLRLHLEGRARQGDPAGAQRLYREHADRLARDGEGAPATETAALAARIAMGIVPSAPQEHAVTVVLVPFTAPGGDDDARELARALEDGVRRRLTRLRGVRLIARSALAAVADQQTPPLEAARAFGGDVVVTGEVRVRGPAAELEVRLEVMRASDGALVRELRHSARRHDLFSVEGVLATAISPALGAVDGEDPDGAPLPAPQTPRDIECHLLCLRGTWHFLRAAHVGGSAQDLEHSRDCFERALSRDPEYGAAHAGLANYFAVCAARGLRSPFEEHFGQAIACSHRALELDPSLGIPHVHFGVRALYLERDWERARLEFETAVRLDRGYAEAHRFLGILLRAQGEAEGGLDALREAVRLEPQIPMFRNSLADALMVDGAPDLALQELEIALRQDPGYRAAIDRLVRCHERSQRFAEAVEARRRSGDAGRATLFGEAFVAKGVDGYRRERRRELEEQAAIARARLTSGAPPTPGERFAPPELALALVLAELGEWDEAWRWEESAAARGLRPWFRARPELAPLASRRSRAETTPRAQG